MKSLVESSYISDFAVSIMDYNTTPVVSSHLSSVAYSCSLITKYD